MKMDKMQLKNVKDLKKELNRNFNDAKKDEQFCKLCKSLNVDINELKKNTSKLLDTTEELDKCRKCRGLFECQTRVEGHVYYPSVYCDKLEFSYAPCKYQKECEKNSLAKMTSGKELENARMKDIDILDKKRLTVIKWLKKFYDEYDPNKKQKGLYLNGSFGSGKTFLIAALFNELKISKKIRTEIIYFPEILRTLKDDWNLFNNKVNYYQNVDLLLIDDIGAEKVTDWGRDEVLGTILQSRMNNNMATFFTSNLSIKELESHLAISKNSEDYVKARRIVERIKQLTDNLELISENRRK